MRSEIQRTDLQLKLLLDEEPAALTNLGDVFEALNPFTKRGFVGAANVRKQEHSNPRVERKIGSQNVRLQLNPNVRDLRVDQQVPLYP